MRLPHRAPSEVFSLPPSAAPYRSSPQGQLSAARPGQSQPHLPHGRWRTRRPVSPLAAAGVAPASPCARIRNGLPPRLLLPHAAPLASRRQSRAVEVPARPVEHATRTHLPPALLPTSLSVYAYATCRRKRSIIGAKVAVCSSHLSTIGRNPCVRRAVPGIHAARGVPDVAAVDILQRRIGALYILQVMPDCAQRRRRAHVIRRRDPQHP